MNKDEHGRRLREAMATRRMERVAVAESANVDVRTVTNWTTGKTMPSAMQKSILRALLGEYDSEGDRVELAVRESSLTEDRQYEVIGFYKRKLREQAAEEPVHVDLQHTDWPLSVAPDRTGDLAAADDQEQTASRESESYHET